MEEGTKKCPDCAEIIKTEANVCKHCGYSFAKAEARSRAWRVIGILVIAILVLVCFGSAMSVW